MSLVYYIHTYIRRNNNVRDADVGARAVSFQLCMYNAR